MKKVIKDFIKKHGKSESGFTMVEILVAIALLAVVVAVVTSTVINATQTSDKFSRGTMNENQLLNAVSTITRDVSLSKTITYAGKDALAMQTIEGNKVNDVFYFYWKGTASTLPSDAAFSQVKNNASKIPAQPGIVEYRIVNGDTANPIVRTLINGYNPGGNAQFPLFAYYDSKNKEILLDATNPPQIPSANLGNVRRVELHFTSYIDSRNKAMEMRTSASPRFTGIAATSVGLSSTLEKPQAPILYGDLTPRTNTSKLWWTDIAGAESYTIWRDNRLQGGTLEVAGVVAGNVNTFDDTSRQWGETYTYTVAAQGFAGFGDPSSAVRLRVTPQPTQFAQISTTRGQGGEPITGWTVARDLTNQLSWDASTGENIKYKLYTVVGGVKTKIYDGPLLTYAHTGRAYGSTTRYVVVAYNDTIPSYNNNFPANVTGGDAIDSPPVDLISPPITPVISGVARNDTTTPATADGLPDNVITVTNTAANPTAKGYDFDYGSSDTTATINGQTSAASVFTHSVSWGSTLYYSVAAYNDAGRSLRTDNGAIKPIKLDQPPGPFNISRLTNNVGYGSVTVQSTELNSLSSVKNDGTMTADWTDASGVASYAVTRDVVNYLGGAAFNVGTFNYESSATTAAGTSSASFSKVQPGAVYRVYVTAKAPNGLTRQDSDTLLTRPDVPRRGTLEAMCLANDSYDGNQRFRMYVLSDTRPLHGRADNVIIDYSKTGNAGAPTEVRGISSAVYASQSLDYLGQVGKIMMQNQVSRANVPDSIARFGTSDAERLSYPLTLEVSVLAPFNGACNTTTGGKIISQEGTTGGYSWVVPIYVCYGYSKSVNYGQYYINPANPTAGGYAYKDYANGYTDSMVQKGSGGCIWRLAPVVGREPFWDAD